MASTELVELSDSDEDDFKESSRKPIGWNYQLGVSKTNKPKHRRNGTAPSPPAPASSDSEEEADDDDIEIIEVNIEPKKKQVMPSSSSRSEIRKQIRGATQSSISNFFSKKGPAEDTNKKNDKKQNKTESEKIQEEEENDKSTATMEEFLRRWEEINVSKDDEKIRDKLWKHYHLAQTSYTHSKNFIQIIESSTQKLTVDNIYVVIKNILDCLKHHKDNPYVEKESGAESAGTSREGTPALNEAENTKRNSRLRKVEKKMKELANKIKEMENQEVDLDDDNNSTYLVEDRLKRQFAKLHDYYCRLANCSSATGRPIERKFKFRGSRWVEINKRITAWVNKHKEFPDYVDILNLVKKVTKQSNLPLRPETVRVQAQEIFSDVGKMLKDRRESDDLYSIYSYVEDETEDPAKHDETLNNQLVENEKIATENLNKVFQEYVDKDGQQRELADLNSKNSSKASEQKNSPVKEDSRTAECQEEEGESSKTESENKVKKDLEVESSTSTSELQVTLKRVSDNCTENDSTEENSDAISDVEEDVSTDGHQTSDSDDDDNDTSPEEIEEDETQDTKEQNASEEGKVEEEDGDETDDDLKGVLASACMDEEEEEEEEEDSEEDIPVMDTEDLLKLELSESDNSSKNSVLCLDDNSQEPQTSDKSSVLCLDENSQELSITTQNNTDVLSTSERNTTDQLSCKTTSVTASPDAPVNTTTSPTSTLTPKPQQKRQLEENLSSCKKLCLSDGNS